MAESNPTAGGYYPPVGFHFRVKFAGIPGNNEMRFQSISGLKADITMETYKEGGSNTFEYQLPTRVKFGDISLKRGLLVGSAVFDWLLLAVNGFQFLPLDLTVDLMNEQGTPLMTWLLMGVLPKGWSIGELDAEKSTLVIEQIDLVVREFLIL